MALKFRFQINNITKRHLHNTYVWKYSNYRAYIQLTWAGLGIHASKFAQYVVLLTHNQNTKLYSSTNILAVIKHLSA